jgi:hypothetical protein
MVCRRLRLGLVRLNTVTTTIAVRPDGVESQALVTAFSELRCQLLCQLGQPSQLGQVCGGSQLGRGYTSQKARSLTLVISTNLI